MNKLNKLCTSLLLNANVNIYFSPTKSMADKKYPVLTCWPKLVDKKYPLKRSPQQTAGNLPSMVFCQSYFARLPRSKLRGMSSQAGSTRISHEEFI